MDTMKQFINSINNPSIEYNVMESSKKFQCYVIKTTIHLEKQHIL